MGNAASLIAQHKDPATQLDVFRGCRQIYEENKSDLSEEEICRLVFLVEPITPEEREEQERQARERARKLQEVSQPQQQGPAAPVRVKAEDRVGRNEPCPCGSGKRYKKCHGKKATATA